MNNKYKDKYKTVPETIREIGNRNIYCLDCGSEKILIFEQNMQELNKRMAHTLVAYELKKIFPEWKKNRKIKALILQYDPLSVPLTTRQATSKFVKNYKQS